MWSISSFPSNLESPFPAKAITCLDLNELFAFTLISQELSLLTTLITSQLVFTVPPLFRKDPSKSVAIWYVFIGLSRLHIDLCVFQSNLRLESLISLNLLQIDQVN